MIGRGARQGQGRYGVKEQANHQSKVQDSCIAFKSTVLGQWAEFPTKRQNSELHLELKKIRHELQEDI